MNSSFRFSNTMARDFRFSPSCVVIKDVRDIEKQWVNINDNSLRKALAVDHQYYEFLKVLLDQVEHKNTDRDDWNHTMPIGLSVRAGMIKNLQLVLGSLSEGALRFYAEKLNIKMNKDCNERTLGHVIFKWKDSSYFYLLEEQWCVLKELHEARNHVHLYKAISNDYDFSNFLANEARWRLNGDKLIPFLQSLSF